MSNFLHASTKRNNECTSFPISWNVKMESSRTFKLLLHDQTQPNIGGPSQSALWVARCVEQDTAEHLQAKERHTSGILKHQSSHENFRAKLNCDEVESRGNYNYPLVEYCERFEDSIKFYTLILWYIVIAFLNFKFLIENPRDHTQLLYIILRILKKTTYNVRVHHFTFFKKSSNYVFGAYSKITYL